MTYTTSINDKHKPITIEEIQKAADLLKELPMPKYPSISEHITSIAMAYKDQLINKVLKQHLNRDPTIEDAKSCTIKYFENENWFLFEYKDKLLGKIDVRLDSSPVDLSRILVYTFIPIT